VRDESDVIQLSVLHHLRVGCTRVLIVDNGSSDATPRILRRLSQRYPVNWTRDGGRFLQAEITTELAREAARQGSDWVVPFDADEFWWSDRRRLPDVLAGSAAGALQARVVNFVQRRGQHRPTAGALARMTWRAETVRAERPARELVESSQIAFVEIDYPPKHVFRAVETVEISKGNHIVSGIPGPVDATDTLVCLHAPLRSRAVLETKAATAQRVHEENPDPDSAWQTKRWGRLAAEDSLDSEWAANSQVSGALNVAGVARPLVVDTRLHDVVMSVMSRSERLRVRLASIREQHGA
jgi:Glycosyl transferase family 2